MRNYMKLQGLKACLLPMSSLKTVVPENQHGTLQAFSRKTSFRSRERNVFKSLVIQEKHGSRKSLKPRCLPVSLEFSAPVFVHAFHSSRWTSVSRCRVPRSLLRFETTSFAYEVAGPKWWVWRSDGVRLSPAAMEKMPRVRSPKKWVDAYCILQNPLSL